MSIENTGAYRPDIPKGEEVQPEVFLERPSEAVVINLFSTQPIEQDASEKPLPLLDHKEMAMLLYNAQGFQAKDISRAWRTNRGISQKSIYDKYGVDNMTQAVSLAVKHNVLTLGMLRKEFDFDMVEELTDEQLDVLRELTVTDAPNSNEAIGQRLGLQRYQVQGRLDKLYSDFELITRPRAAAFYLLSAKLGLIHGDETNFVDDGHPTRVIASFPGYPPEWRPRAR